MMKPENKKIIAFNPELLNIGDSLSIYNYTLTLMSNDLDPIHIGRLLIFEVQKIKDTKK